MHAKAPPTGTYVPTLSFWKDKWNLGADLDTFRTHLTRLADEGIRGVTLFSYFGEGAYVSQSERQQFLEVAKEVLKPKGVTILVECSRESLWETREKIQEAYEGGADYAFLNVPMVFLEEINLDDVFAYFHQLSEWAEIPFVIRTPASDSPLAFDRAFVRRLSAIPKCVGCLLPAFEPMIAKVAEDHCDADDFAIFCTYPGDLGPSKLKVRLQGSIGNISPFTMARFYETDANRFSETMELILTTKVLKEIATKVTALKYAMTRVRGYGGTCRPPLPVPHPELRARVDPILPSLAGDFFRRRWMELEGMELNEDSEGSDVASAGTNTPRD